MDREASADEIITHHMVWAIGSGLIPMPILDLAAVTAIQVDMLQKLGRVHGIEWHEDLGKTFVAALTGSSLARLGSSAIKALPGIGTLFGGLSMAVLAGASTYAVGRVAVRYLAAGRKPGEPVDEELAEVYESELEAGRAKAEELGQGLAARKQDPIQALEGLKHLHDTGVIDDDEFAAKKRELLDRI